MAKPDLPDLTVSSEFVFILQKYKYQSFIIEITDN